jgi:HEAT repeat protein
LIRRLTEDDYYLRYEAVLALARIGTAAVPRLVETLHAPSSRVRAGAARAIGYVSPPPEDAVAPLVMALQDADADVRYFAADALAGADTLPHLTLLLEDEKPAMRIGAAYALGRRPWRWNPASRESGSSAYAVTMVRALAKALQDEDVQVRRVAAESLAYFGTNPSADVSTPGLKEAMRDVDPTVRFRAAKALAAILRKRKDPEEKPEAYEAESQRVADSSPIAHYYGFADDLKIMRLTFESEGPPSIWSPGEAQSAAFHVFRNTPLVGLTKKEALQLLGDPIRMSQFDERARSDPDTPLQYKFDNGYGGTEYTLHFKDGRLTRIEVRGFA